MRRRRIAAGTGLSIGAALGAGATANAADFTVTTLTDGAAPGPAGSLRKAISDANAAAGADQILFDASLSGSIMMTSTSMPITEALTVSGPGADVITVDGYYGTGRIFTVNPVVAGAPVTISGLTMAFAATTGSGGAILNDDAKLIVEESTLGFNVAAAGGVDAIGGGAIYDSANYANGTETAVRSSTLFLNHASGGAGGAIGSPSQLGRITDSTIWNNYAKTDGGAIFSTGGGTIVNSTFDENDAGDDGGAFAIGGASGPSPTIENSIFGRNRALLGTGEELFGAVPFNAEFSLFFWPDAAATINPTVPGSNVLGVDARLPLQFPFDDPLPTLDPPFDSPVVDKGKAAAGATTDQRGEPRPFDSPSIANSAATGADGADIGAVELTLNETTPADLALSMTVSPDPVTVGSPVTASLQVTNNGPENATGVHAFFLPLDGLSFNAAGSSPTCTVTAPPDPVVDCVFDSVLSGATETQTVVASTLPSSFPTLYTYGYVGGDQADPEFDNNYAYEATTVSVAPTVTPLTPDRPFDFAAAVKKCKKKFQGKAKAKKRKKCIKRAKQQGAASAAKASANGIGVEHPFVLRERPPGLELVESQRRNLP